MPRPWENLSDREFEVFLAELLGEGSVHRFEVFTRGADLGIDLRRITPQGQVEVVQAKHYIKSSFADLKRAAKKEREKLIRLQPQPTIYRFATSQGLTPHRKSELAAELSPYIRQDNQIIGQDDIELLLNEHSEIERNHIKLWLTGGTQLHALIHSGTFARSRALAAQIVESLPRYVQTRAFYEAAQALQKNHSLVIVGPPGIGKTTLAKMLLVDLSRENYEIIEISSDINEAWDVWDETKCQAFLYDDFLGRTLLNELQKGEGSRLLSFMRESTRSKHTRIILTTREYILNNALVSSESFRRHGFSERFILELSRYSDLDKAKILHNHVWHSEMTPESKRSLSKDRSYYKILHHNNFNPRVIEYITGLQSGHKIVLRQGESWLDFALRSLDSPDEIWQQAFSVELGQHEQVILLAMGTLPGEVQIDDLRLLFDSWCRTLGLHPRVNQFEISLKILEGSFLSTNMEDGSSIFITIQNPGLQDFVQRQISLSKSSTTRALQAAEFFEQIPIIWRLVKTNEWMRSVSEFEESINRLFARQSCEYSKFSKDNRQPRMRVHPSLDARFAFLVELTLSENVSVPVVTAVQRLLEQRFAVWRTGVGDLDWVRRLVELLDDNKRLLLPDDIFLALRDLLAGNLDTPDTWRDLIEIAELRPDDCSSSFLEDLSDDFLEFAKSELRFRSPPIDTEDELDALLYIARHLGVSLERQMVEDTKELIQARDWAEDAASDRGIEKWKDRDRSNEYRERDEIERLFHFDESE